MLRREENAKLLRFIYQSACQTRTWYIMMFETDYGVTQVKKLIILVVKYLQSKL